MRTRFRMQSARKRMQAMKLKVVAIIHVLMRVLEMNFKHGGGGSCVMKKRVTLPWTSAPLPCPGYFRGEIKQGVVKLSR